MLRVQKAEAVQYDKRTGVINRYAGTEVPAEGLRELAQRASVVAEAWGWAPYTHLLCFRDESGGESYYLAVVDDTPPSVVRLTGWDAIRYAEEHPDAVLAHYSTPIEEARSGVTLAEAREIARDDASLVYCDIPCEELAAEFRRVFGRPARIVDARRDNTEAAVVVDGWPEAIWYQAGPAWTELQRWEDGAGEDAGDADVCRALDQVGAFRGYYAE